MEDRKLRRSWAEVALQDLDVVLHKLRLVRTKILKNTLGI
jgi:hypothetical protein